MDQPLTPAQLVVRTKLNRARCSESLTLLRNRGCVFCYNPDTRVGKVFWLTDEGIRAQRALCEDMSETPPEHYAPDTRWDLYGPVTTAHRSAAICALHGSMHAAQIRRRAVQQDRFLRFSVNHCFDALCYLTKRRIVTRVREKEQRYPSYRLTRLGQEFQRLLMRAREWMRWRP